METATYPTDSRIAAMYAEIALKKWINAVLNGKEQEIKDAQIVSDYWQQVLEYHSQGCYELG